ncbi:MAG: hypothetical protein HRS57_03475 [Mycoplasmataceae bacterium]|nr:hypothetical protein [Mycoplasmataceae bacterium]
MSITEAEEYIETAIEIYIEEETGNAVNEDDFIYTFSWDDYSSSFNSFYGSVIIEPTKNGNWYNSQHFGNLIYPTPNQKSDIITFNSSSLYNSYKISKIGNGLILTIFLSIIGAIIIFVFIYFVYRHYKK